MAAQTCQTVLSRSDVLSYNVRSFRLKLVAPPRLAFEAGQFVIVHIPAKDLPPTIKAAQAGGIVKRAYSIASPPHEEGVIELCIQHIDGGAASTFFWNLKEGMPVTVSGPHGRFLLKQPLDYEPIFLATGTGVAPLRGMIQHLFHVNATQPVRLFAGCRYEHSVLYEAEFRALASVRHNFQYVPTVSRPKEWKGETGHVQETFRTHVRDFANKEIYICGWLEVVKAIAKDLESYGVPPAQIHYEEWG